MQEEKIEIKKENVNAEEKKTIVKNNMTKEYNNDNEIKNMSIFWYQSGAVSIMKEMDRARIKEIALEIDSLSAEQPLHITKQKFKLKSYQDKEFSGLQLIAWLSVAIDILSGKQLSSRGMTQLGDLELANKLNEI